MRTLSFAILILVSLGATFPGYASNEITKSGKAKKANALAKNKKLGVDQSDFMPAANKFGLIASYSLSFNQQEQVSDKTINHSIALAGTYSFNHHWSTYLSIAANHQTYNNKVFRANESDNFHSFSDVNLGLVYSKMKPLSFVRRSSNTLNLVLPASERSRYDRVRGQISLTNFMQSYTWKDFSLFNRLFANYQWNSLSHSVTTDLINRDWVFSNSLGVNYSLTPRIGLRASLRSALTNYLDGSSVFGFGNSLTAFANYWGCQFFASYINRSYPESDRIEPIYFDQYRQVISAGVTYAF